MNEQGDNLDFLKRNQSAPNFTTTVSLAIHMTPCVDCTWHSLIVLLSLALRSRSQGHKKVGVAPLVKYLTPSPAKGGNE